MTESHSFDTGLAAPASVIPVSMLNRLAREYLESAFPLCWVAGEVSNLTYAASGHAYFSLKDADAQVRCVMFRNRAQLLGWRLENGQHIEARVLVTLYETRGDFQLNVETVRKAGIGNLYEQFLRLKTRLESEGLFSPEKKRPLPRFPASIGIITSLQAAALRDVLSTLARRAPQVRLIIYPTAVQGEGAPAQIAAVLREASQRAECDVLILCRGGGSLEDLWAFNDETLAREIRACRLPVITGIGHETDFTIVDFVADQRAPTPTAAAELATPDRAALISRLDTTRFVLRRQIQRSLEQRQQQIDLLAHRLQHPAQRLATQREQLLNLQRRMNSGLTQAASQGRQTLSDLTRRLLLARPNTGTFARRFEALPARLSGAWQRQFSMKKSELDRLSASLGHLNPEAVLARGFSIVTNATGLILRDTHALEPNERIAVCLHSGRLEARVENLSHATTAPTLDQTS